MFAVDTNILIDAVNVDSPFYPRCRALADGWTRQPSGWFLTWGVVYEFLRVSTHRNIFRNPLSAAESWAFVESLMASPGLRMLVPTERHRTVAGEVLRELPHLAGNIMHDAETAILMREHGVRRIYTRDLGFHRFPFLETIDPTV